MVSLSAFDRAYYGERIATIAPRVPDKSQSKVIRMDKVWHLNKLHPSLVHGVFSVSGVFSSLLITTFELENPNSILIICTRVVKGRSNADFITPERITMKFQLNCSLSAIALNKYLFSGANNPVIVSLPLTWLLLCFGVFGLLISPAPMAALLYIFRPSCTLSLAYLDPKVPSSRK